METLVQDVKHSLRMFWQNRGFTAAAVLALALGIGLNTAIFSVVNTILLKPPRFPDADRLVLMITVFPQGRGGGASPAKFQHWREQSNVVEDVSAFRSGVLNFTGGDFPEQLRSGQVSADFFRLFGVPIIRGRAFTPEEDRPNGPAVTLISEGFWTRRFARDPEMIGKTILLGGTPHTVIGIVGDDFDFRELSAPADVWVPFQLNPNTSDQGHYFTAAARLKPGVSLRQAQDQLAASAAGYRQKFPGALPNDNGFSVDAVREALVRNVRSSLLVLVAAVSLVLLIACANVANLLLARAVGRKREMAVRAAIGAGRGRIVRQLLTESFLLAAAGAIIGSILGYIGIRALLMVNTAGLPRLGEKGSLVSLDARVLAFTALATVVTSILFGLIPALQASRIDLSGTLKEAGSRSGSGFRQNKARTVLVVSELALAVVLVIGAGLLIRTQLALAEVRPGFEPEQVLTMRMSLSDQKYQKTAVVEQLIRDGADRLRAVPGVITASASCCIPLEGGYGLPFIVVGRPLDNGPFHGGGGWKTISPGYFETFSIPIVKGRSFTERDTASSEPVVIINQAMARRFWPNADPLNQRIWIGKGVMSELASEKPRLIVGIAGDVRDGALNQEPQPSMYVPNAQVPDALNALNVRLTPLAWVVRARGEPKALTAAIQEQLRQVSGLPISDVRTMTEVVSRSTSRQRFNMLLMSVFGASALFLAAIGVYGLMSYSVQQRQQEIGIRMALGAEASDVRNMVVTQGMRFAIIGVLVGTAASFGLARLIATLLYGVTAWDPLVFIAVPVTLASVALIAILVPASRATRVDPISALRYE